jgi:hypothetical protein
MTMWTAMVLAIFWINQSAARAQNRPVTEAKPGGAVAASRPGEREVDLATSINEMIDSAEIRISPKMYRAIQAVERYRNQVQKTQLTPSETNLDNFNITITPATTAPATSWLSDTDKKCCYVVVLSPRLAKGERVATDRHGKVGRVSVYGVRKTNYEVVQAQIGEP